MFTGILSNRGLISYVLFIGDVIFYEMFNPLDLMEDTC